MLDCQLHSLKCRGNNLYGIIYEVPRPANYCQKPYHLVSSPEVLIILRVSTLIHKVLLLFACVDLNKTAVIYQDSYHPRLPRSELFADIPYFRYSAFIGTSIFCRVYNRHYILIICFPVEFCTAPPIHSVRSFGYLTKFS